MSKLTVIGIAVLCGGVWILQDAVASILYYLHKPEEKWYYNQACRAMRGAVGLGQIAMGILLILN